MIAAARQPPYFYGISRTRVASAPIAKGFVIIDIPAARSVRIAPTLSSLESLLFYECFWR
jgi:hypothetical protein